jgi:hypothetical protein
VILKGIRIVLVEERKLERDKSLKDLERSLELERVALSLAMIVIMIRFEVLGLLKMGRKEVKGIMDFQGWRSEI